VIPLEVPAPLVEAGHLLVAVAYSLISSGTEISTLRGVRLSLVHKAMRQLQKGGSLLAYLVKNGEHYTIARIQDISTTRLSFSAAGE